MPETTKSKKLKELRDELEKTVRLIDDDEQGIFTWWDALHDQRVKIFHKFDSIFLD